MGLLWDSLGFACDQHWVCKSRPRVRVSTKKQYITHRLSVAINSISYPVFYLRMKYLFISCSLSPIRILPDVKLLYLNTLSEGHLQYFFLEKGTRKTECIFRVKNLKSFNNIVITLPTKSINFMTI